MCCKEICNAFNASHECIEGKTLMVSEKGKRFILESPDGSKNTFCCIHVDGCLIKDLKRRKCDYWFRQCSKETVPGNYFVELKGSNIRDGFDQIVSTIQQAREKGIDLPQKTIRGFIVLGKFKFPKADVTRQTLEDKFEKNHGSKLTIAKNTYKLVLD